MYKGSDGKVIFSHDYGALVEEMGLNPSFSDSQFILSSLTDCKENQAKARIITLLVAIIPCIVCVLVAQSFLTLQPHRLTHQAPLSVGFSRQEHWSGLPFPSPGDLPDPRIESKSPALAGKFFTNEPPGKSCYLPNIIIIIILIWQC